MTDQASIASNPEAKEHNRQGGETEASSKDKAVQLGSLLLTLVAAQLLVFHHYPGSGLALFLLLLLGLITVIHRKHAARFWLIFTVPAILILFAHVAATTFLLAAILLVLFSFARADRLPADDWQKLKMVATTLFVGPALAVPQLENAAHAVLGRMTTGRRRFASLRRSFVPILAAVAFVALFLPANPWLAISVDFVNPVRWLTLPSPLTIGMWLVLALLVWPILNLRSEESGRTSQQAAALALPGVQSILNTGTLPAIALFNGIFALQTASDLTTLWPSVMTGGSSNAILPAGMTYSEFARAGAYPLLVAAILAAAIILLAMGDSDRSGRVKRLLIIAWIAQTLFLLGSAALRLDLYVDAYGLTRLRLYTFLGMGLIFCGLGLATWRVVAGRTNQWLVRANLMMVTLAVLACGATNLDGYIAERNIARLARDNADGLYPAVDTDYLCALGIGALPQISLFLARGQGAAESYGDLTYCYSDLRATLIERQDDWRSWSWRGSRILDRSPMLLVPNESTRNSALVERI